VRNCLAISLVSVFLRAAIVMVTHDPQVAGRAGKIIEMADGRARRLER